MLIVPREGKSLNEEIVKNLRNDIQSWDRNAQGNPVKQLSRIIQLYHARQAEKIAEALKPADNSGVRLTAIEHDKLAILGNNETVIRRLRQLITLIDQPRPQITLHLWGLQISSRDSAIIEERVKHARSLIRYYDHLLRNVYTIAWNRLSEIVQANGNGTEGPSGKFDRTLWSYLTCSVEESSGAGSNPGELGFQPYCLGYDFRLEGAPSLSRMLIMLAMTTKPWKNAKIIFTEQFLHEKSLRYLQQNIYKHNINRLRNHRKKKDSSDDYMPEFVGLFNTLGELENLLTGETLNLFRAAILDYLFHYRWSVLYPENSVPYHLTTSAGRLDSLLGPVVDALTTDIQNVVEKMQSDTLWPRTVEKKLVERALRKVVGKADPALEGVATSGLVTVVSLSAKPSEVSGETLSHYGMSRRYNFGSSMAQHAIAGFRTLIGGDDPLTDKSIGTMLDALQGPSPDISSER